MHTENPGILWEEEHERQYETSPRIQKHLQKPWTYCRGLLVVAKLGEAVGHRLPLAQGGAVDPLDGRGDSVRQGRVDDALLAALRVRVHRGALAAVKCAVSCNNSHAQ